MEQVDFIFPVNIGPGFATAADLNGDGKLDVITTNETSGDISVLLGNGNGTFQPAVHYPVGSFPEYVGVGDFDGDGRPDLAVANFSFGTVAILLNNGDGSFRPAGEMFSGSGATSVAVADFNGDGRQDLAVANFSSSVSIFLGNGDGTFRDPMIFYTDYATEGIAVGDFNGDGKLDLVTANFLDFVEISDVSILLGNGDGTFQDMMNFPTHTGSVAVAVGDFNGDGKQDVAVANERSGDVSILLGNGDGTFSPAGTYFVGEFDEGISAGDFNGDGKLDLVTANWLYDSMHGSNDVTVLLGNGDGTFQPGVHYPAGVGPSYPAVGDFNGDGILDLAVSNYFSNDVHLLRGNGDGTFQPASGGGGGQVAFVQEKDNYFANASPASSESLAFTANNGAAHLLIAIVGWDSAVTVTSVTDARGNSYSSLPSMAVGSHVSQLWYAANSAAGGNTVTANFGGGGATYVQLTIAEYSGVATGAPLDQHAEATGTSASPSSPNVTTTRGGELLIGYADDAQVNWAATAPRTLRSTAANVRSALADQLNVAAGTYNTSFTMSSIGNWGCGIATFAPPSGRVAHKAKSFEDLFALGGGSSAVSGLLGNSLGAIYGGQCDCGRSPGTRLLRREGSGSADRSRRADRAGFGAARQRYGWPSDARRLGQVHAQCAG